MEGLLIALLLFGLCYITIAETTYNSCNVPSVQEGRIYLSDNELMPPTSVQHMAMVLLRCNVDNRVFNSRCDDGRWSKSLQSCIKTSCSRPNTPNYVFQFINDTVELREDPRREFPLGTFIISRCQDPGKYKFHPTSSVQRRCTTSGWTGQQPICNVRCDDPGLFLNGVQNGFNYILTREVSFSCNEGYILEGPSAITCNLGGWSGEIPTCRSDQCPEYVLPDNMRDFAGSGFHTGAIRMFMCQSGFTFGSGVSQVTVQCKENGQWSPEIPSCSAMVHAATPSPGIDACSIVQCELWEVCGVINNEGKCYCTKPSDCPFTKSAEDMVCGSDGREYDSYCHLKATSCFFGRSITVSNNGTCPEEEDNDLNCGEGLGPLVEYYEKVRVIIGDDAVSRAWPWMVGLYKYAKDLRRIKHYQPEFFCGGSLISNDMVLTAAHCFGPVEDMEPQDIIVTAGSTERILDRGRIHRPEADLQILQVAELIKHEQFDYFNTGLDYDIALLRLQSNVNITSRVSPVCIPESSFERYNDLLQVGTNGTTYPYVTGWGYTKQFADVHPIDLQQTSMPVRNRQTCAASLENPEEFTERMICAGFIEGERTDRGEIIHETGQIDACKGDSGGPLVRARDVGGKYIYYQIGIVSWGVGCAEKDNFGFYTHVPLLVDWINNKTASRP